MFASLSAPQDHSIDLLPPFAEAARAAYPKRNIDRYVAKDSQRLNMAQMCASRSLIAVRIFRDTRL
jgi:hypothetical protein